MAKKKSEISEEIEKVEPTVEPEVEPTVEPEVEPTVEPEVEPTVEPEVETGAVTPGVVNCKALNVREGASKDTKSVCVLAEGTKLQVDIENSTDDFYSISASVNGTTIEGYCMKKFITIE